MEKRPCPKCKDQMQQSHEGLNKWFCLNCGYKEEQTRFT